jgi:hypothetical protein
VKKKRREERYQAKRKRSLPYTSLCLKLLEKIKEYPQTILLRRRYGHYDHITVWRRYVIVYQQYIAVSPKQYHQNTNREQAEQIVRDNYS